MGKILFWSLNFTKNLFFIPKFWNLKKKKILKLCNQFFYLFILFIFIYFLLLFKLETKNEFVKI